MKGAIACGHEKTAEVIVTILEAGGNAFDAAIAAIVAMTITEPCMSSLAGGGYAQIKTRDGKIRSLDFFCQTPSQKSPNQTLIPINVDFGGTVECYYGGHGASAVPGTPAFIQTLLNQLATMPLKELLQPAIQLAKQGVNLTPFQYQDISLLKQFFEISPTQSKHLFNEFGLIKDIGSPIYFHDLAHTLEFIAEEGTDDFYVGEIAQLFFQEHEQQGGIQQPADWKNYKAIWREPLRIPFANSTIFTAPLPSIGGLWLRTFLNNLSASPVPKPFSASHQEVFMEAFKTIQPLRENPSTLETLYPELSNNVLWQNQATKGTSHFNIVDQWGNAIAVTSTIGAGCGKYIGNTGIYLNNMLGEEGLMPNGINSWVPNSRLHTNTCPTIVQANDGTQELILGSGGSIRIPYAIGQVIYNHYALGLHLEQAVQAPRVHHDEQEFHIEPGFQFPIKTAQTCFWDQQNLYFGGVHAISTTTNQMHAVGDQRREGFAKTI